MASERGKPRTLCLKPIVALGAEIKLRTRTMVSLDKGFSTGMDGHSFEQLGEFDTTR